MAATATPYGLVPHSMLGGGAYTGAFEQFPIASGYATRICNGSVVCITASGVVERIADAAVGTTANPFPAGTIGVFVGCSYTDSTLGYISRNFWPASTVTADAKAHVVTDPDVVFRVQANGQVPQTDLHQNMGIVAETSTATSGKSNISLAIATKDVTATIALKIIGFYEVTGVSAINDAFTDVLVKFNNSSHAYLAGTGI